MTVRVRSSAASRIRPVYLYTAEQMGLQPEECLVIEDSTVGITAGHCAGMTVAALIDNRFSFDRSLADYELNSLEEIVPLAGENSGFEVKFELSKFRDSLRKV